MKSLKIQESIKGLTVSASASLHKRLLDDLLRMMEVAEQEHVTINRPKFWQMALKYKIFKLAMAAAVIIAIIIGIDEFAGHYGTTNVALAEMITNMKEMPWVHWTIASPKSGEPFAESWFCFATAIFAHKRNDGALLYNNAQQKTEYTYSPEKGVIYFSENTERISEQETLPDNSFQFIELVVDSLKKGTAKISGERIIQDNQEVEILTYQMHLGSQYDHIKLKRDIRRNLLVSIEGHAKDGNNILAVFDYPVTGPESIYDLGLPRNTRIATLIRPTDVSQLIKKLDTLRATRFTNYVAVSVPSDINKLPASFEGRRPEMYFTIRDNLVSTIWRKGDERCHSMGYFSEVSGATPSLESIPENVQGTAELLISVSTDIYKENEKQIYHYQLLNGEPVQNVRKGSVEREAYGQEVFLEKICWPQIVIPQNSPVQWKMDSVSGPTGETLVMIERVTEHGTHRWFLNPTRDFICQRYEVLVGSFEHSMEVLEYAKTGTGHWYPRRICKIISPVGKNGEDKGKEIICRLIYLQEMPSFPVDIFDPEKLPTAR